MTDIPPAPHPPTPQPPMWPAPIAPTPAPGSGMATGALVTGITSLIPAIGVILGVIAVILSALVLHRNRPGRTMAVAGLTMGILGILLNCLAIGASWYLATNRAMPRAKQAVCRANLKNLATATMMYSVDYDEQPPPNLAALNPYLGGPGAMMTCPSRKNPQPGRLDYVYVPPATRIIRVERPGDTILMCDLKGNHDDGRNVAFVDGHVRWMTESEFQSRLAQPHNATFADGLRKIEGP